jgi:uncharacterized protein (UPF0332 family)
MSVHADLLEQARHLLRRESRRPKQASLRRAISAAYYALFHLLTIEASRVFVRDDELIGLINRTYSHGQMNRISVSFANGDLPRRFDSVRARHSISNELKNLAAVFTELQQARHEADYNLNRRFNRKEAAELVQKVENAFVDWNVIRSDDIARIYLACFLLWDDWNKDR